MTRIFDPECGASLRSRCCDRGMPPIDAAALGPAGPG